MSKMSIKPLAKHLRRAADKIDPPAQKKRTRAKPQANLAHQPVPTGFYIRLGALVLPAFWDATFPANILVHGDDLKNATGTTPSIEPDYYHCKSGWVPFWNRLGYFRLDEIPDAIAPVGYKFREACATAVLVIHSTYQWPYSIKDYPSRDTITAALKHGGFINTPIITVTEDSVNG